MAVTTDTQPNIGYAVFEKGGSLKKWNFERRAIRPTDVAIKVMYCGICHSDLHYVKDGWTDKFPLVPGHEIVGTVTELGSSVTQFKIGDVVMIGTIIDSCRTCHPCQEEMEVYCREFPTTTIDGKDRIDGSRIQGGYSNHYIADEHFVYPLPEGLDPAAAAPLLCAGITTYSPLKHWDIGPGKTVGIIGIGGLGHLGVKFARAMGAHVVAFTTSAAKSEEALKLGAHEVVVSKDDTQMKAQAFRLDFLLDTVSQQYPMDAFLQTLKMDGTLCSLGIPDRMDFSPMFLAMGRRRIASSGTGGTRDTKEMLEFCQKHSITADVEVVKADEVNTALDRLAKGDVRFRFVLDLRDL